MVGVNGNDDDTVDSVEIRSKLGNICDYADRNTIIPTVTLPKDDYTRKVPKDYFGSHLLRESQEVRRLLIEGLCQAGDVRIPKVTIVRRLKPFLEDDLDGMFPDVGWTRVIAHPRRKMNGSGENNSGDDDDDLGTVRRMRDAVLASNEGVNDGTVKNIVLAVGPEGGWDEPYELDMFRRCGFTQITLGTRILRTDVAVVSLLSLAHDSLCAVR